MNKTPKSYKDLIFWQKSFKTATLVINLSRKLPRTIENRIILNQLLRSVMSIGANIAEGYGRYGTKEFSRYLQISLGSANETEYWLLLLKEANPKHQEEIDKVKELNIESIKMLAKSIQTLKNKIK
ncbi:MAG: four helix bundle protein [Patescibacteria group bacterium]